jgi:hypothetical protein
MKYLPTLFVSVFVLASHSLADTPPPCYFKSVAVGDKLTPEEIATALDAGLLDACNPSSDGTTCQFIAAMFLGDIQYAVRVTIGVRGGIVGEIAVNFGFLYWDDVLPVIYEKFGQPWRTTLRKDVAVVDRETGKDHVVEKIEIERIADGVNPQTNTRCRISATNLDSLFAHDKDVVGLYQASVVIRRISTDF